MRWRAKGTRFPGRANRAFAVIGRLFPKPVTAVMRIGSFTNGSSHSLAEDLEGEAIALRNVLFMDCKNQYEPRP
jgi:hypothetical protein